MFDLELLDITYHQQELRREALALALAATVHPAYPSWRQRALRTLKSIVSGFPWGLPRGASAYPVPAVVRVASPRRGRKHT